MVQGTNQNSSFRLLKTVKNRDTKAYFEKLQSHTHSHHASTTKNKNDEAPVSLKAPVCVD